MKVAYFTKYSRKGASSRLRSYQFFPQLKDEGVNITVNFLFGDSYLNKLYAKEDTKFEVIYSYAKRFFQLLTVFNYDLVVIEKELFPYFPSVIERVLARLGVHYIVDFDDAIFHNYDQSSNFLVRYFLSNKIDKVMKYSSWVFAGNSYLKERSLTAGARNVQILPTVIDAEKYQVSKKQGSEIFTIGWIGSPSTVKYLEQLNEVFKLLSKKYTFKVIIIGSNRPISYKGDVSYIEWNENTEVDLIQQFDVGVMPLIDSIWEKGKCSYKLIQYMGCGVPVLASPVGMNVEVVEHNTNGFLCKSQTDWYEYLEMYIKDPLLRDHHGENGRLLIDKKYNIKENLKQILRVFNLVGKFHPLIDTKSKSNDSF